MKKQYQNILIILIILLTTSSTNAQRKSLSNNPSLNLLLEMVFKRLDLMDDVAAAKYNAGLPVTDTVREKEVLRKWSQAAKLKGLDTISATLFMEWQIFLATNIQQRLIEGWSKNKQHFPGSSKSLTEIRKELDTIATKQLELLYQCSLNFKSGKTKFPKSEIDQNFSILIPEKPFRIELYKRILSVRRSEFSQ